MSILVNPNETFQIEINFQNYSVICEALRRDFKTMSSIIEESTIINSVNGKPFLRNKILCFRIMLNFIKSIKVINEDNEEYLSINESTINNMEYDVVKAICKKWLEMTSGK